MKGSPTEVRPHGCPEAAGEDLPVQYTVTLDDDPMVPRMIQKALGMRSLSFTSVGKLLAEADRYQPVAAFIDIHLDASSGLEAIPTLRAKWSFCPIIVVTSDPSDEAVTEALACGADDFVRKPIRPKELTARLHARLLDQAQKEAKNTIHLADVMLDRYHRLLRGPRGDRYLSSTELNLFLSLLQARGTIVPRKTLKLRCWGEIAVSDNALDRKIYEVRRALQEVGSRLGINTAYGVGFALDNTEGPPEIRPPGEPIPVGSSAPSL